MYIHIHVYNYELFLGSNFNQMACNKNTLFVQEANETDISFQI